MGYTIRIVKIDRTMTKIRADILTRFTTEREEPLREQLTLRVSASMKKKIKGRENWQEFVRETLDKALAELEKEEEKNLKSA